MTQTDSPLKQLIDFFITDFAAWFLDADVREAQPLNVELPAESIWADEVFRVSLANGRSVILHLEFQGWRSRAPMRERMLDYMSRLARTHPGLDLCRIVFYVERGGLGPCITL